MYRTMAHKFYLDHCSEETKSAFLNGCQCMMQVIAHCNPKHINILVSRDDEDWIRYICDQEQERAEREERGVTAHILQSYQPIDREIVRGMILDCGRINDEGLEIDENGQVCDHQPYPYQVYECMASDTYPPLEISSAEYLELSPEEQEMFMRRCYVELTTLDGRSKRRFWDGNQAFMAIVLEQILPHEPAAVMDLYRKALEDKSSDIIQTYSSLFSSAFSFREFAVGFQTWLGNDDINEDTDENAPDNTSDTTDGSMC